MIRGATAGRLTYVAGFLLSALACLAAVSGALVLNHTKLREWVYRETSYRVVLASVLSSVDQSNPEEITSILADYVQGQIYPNGGPVIDTDSWTHLVRGIGWCDQRAWTIGTFLALTGIHSRLVMLRDEFGVSTHTVLEILLGGRWGFLDPNFNFILHKPDGSLASVEDLSGDLTLLVNDPVFSVLEPEGQAYILERYVRLFPIRTPPTVWGSILDARQRDWRKALGRRIVTMFWRIFGRAGAHWLQDVYLAKLSPIPPVQDARLLLEIQQGFSDPQLAEARRLYYQARNYHLYGRYEKAQGRYQEIVRQYGSTQYAERSQFWLGRLELRQGKVQGAINRLTEFLHTWPESTWKTRAYKLLAIGYRRVGEMEHARDFERLALRDPLVSTTTRLAVR